MTAPDAKMAPELKAKETEMSQPQQPEEITQLDRDALHMVQMSRDECEMAYALIQYRTQAVADAVAPLNAEIERLTAELAIAKPLKVAPVQGERYGPKGMPLGTIPWQVHALAAKEYNRNHIQSAERLAERGGFSWVELIACLRGDYTPGGCKKAFDALSGEGS